MKRGADVVPTLPGETSSEVLIVDFLVPFQDGTVLFPGILQTPAKKPVQGWKPGSPPDVQGASIGTPRANSIEATS